MLQIVINYRSRFLPYYVIDDDLVFYMYREFVNGRWLASKRFKRAINFVAVNNDGDGGNYEEDVKLAYLNNAENLKSGIFGGKGDVGVYGYEDSIISKKEKVDDS